MPGTALQRKGTKISAENQPDVDIKINMKKLNQGMDARKECERLRQIVERDRGTAHLSPTEFAFLQSVCTPGKEGLSETEDVVFASASTIDNSGGNQGGTIMDDPDTGRPDDADDANPAASDPAITKE